MKLEKEIEMDKYNCMVNAMRKQIACLEEKNRRQEELLFQTLELMRKQVEINSPTGKMRMTGFFLSWISGNSK